MLLLRGVRAKGAEDVRKFLHQVPSVEVAALEVAEDALLLCHHIHVLVGVFASEPSAEGAVLDKPSSAVTVQQLLQMAEHDRLLQFVVQLYAGVQLGH